MTAQYRAGRQADALAAYRRVQQLLDDELGLEPGPELQLLEQQVLNQDPALLGIVEPAGPAPGNASKRSASVGNLPGHSSPLIGREVDLKTLLSVLAAERLVTITGLAGVGKTRLAVEVARNCALPAGSWLVRLESAPDSAGLTQLIASALNMAGSTQAQLIDRLGGPAMLLVLDNCEHLIDEVAAIVSLLLTAAPELHVLATSQLPLRLDGERVYQLGPLATPDAVTLFTQRAVARRGWLAVDDGTAPLLDELCRSLDGLPLAIELAAARTKALSVQEISQRLSDRFRLLADPTSRGPARHRTLHAAISWSYELLFPDDQRGLWALSCFADGAPLGAVEQVVVALGIPLTAALDVIERLVDRSLVGLEVGADGGVRYRLLDSVRAFAAEKLLQSGARDAVGQAHAQWFADAAALAARGSRGREQSTHLALARNERANIDTALAWAAVHDPLLGLRIANGFGWVWVVAGDGVAGATRIRSALAAADQLALPVDQVTALLFASWLEASAGNLERATAEVDHAATLAHRVGDRLLVAQVRWYRGFVLVSQSRPRDALIELEAAGAVFHEFGDEWHEGGSWLLVAYAQLALGQLAAGAAACHRALSLIEMIGDQWGLGHAEGMLGNLARAEHRLDDAVQHLSAAAESAAALGFSATAGYHLSNLGRVQQLNGDSSAALDTLAAAIETARVAGDFRLLAETQLRLGRVLRGVGERDAALEMIESANRWYASFGGGEGALLAECLLAAMHSESGSAEADSVLQTILARARTAAEPDIK